MDLLAYFPAGMKAGDELSYTTPGNSPKEQTLEVVSAQEWHVSLKSKAFALSVRTDKNVASLSAPSTIRVGASAFKSTDANADTSTGKLIVTGGFEEVGREIAIIETGYTAAQDTENPGSSSLALGAFGAWANQTLTFQLVV